MRIIKNGVIPTKEQKKDLIEYKAKCWNCDCIFAYHKYEKKMDFGGSMYLECPSCDSSIYKFFDIRIKD